jgi:oxygen-independent coproporphyrinogen-3 oxidase
MMLHFILRNSRHFKPIKRNGNGLTISSNKIVVTETGKAFVRNICMAFDLKMKRARQLVSMTI